MPLISNQNSTAEPDSAFARAINGVARPIFYQGQQIGERRYYDERLTQFMLRYRDPVRYGRWLDGYEARRHLDGAGIALACALNAVTDAGYRERVPDEEEEEEEEFDTEGVDAPDEPDELDEHDELDDDEPEDDEPDEEDGDEAPLAPYDYDDPTPPAEDVDVRDKIRWALRQTSIRHRKNAAEGAAHWERERRRGRGGADPSDETPEDDPETGWQSPLIVHRPIRTPRVRKL